MNERATAGRGRQLTAFFFVTDDLCLEDPINDDDRSDYPQPDPRTWTCTAVKHAGHIPQMCPHVEQALPGIGFILHKHKAWMKRWE